MADKQIPDLTPAESVDRSDLIHLRQGAIDKYASVDLLLADVDAEIDSMKSIYTTTGASGAYLLATGDSLTALTAGMFFMIKLNHTNPGNVTLQVDSTSALAVLDCHLKQISAGAYASGGTYFVVYDGTRFISVGLNNYATNAEAVAGTDTTKIITPSSLAAAITGASISFASQAEVEAGTDNTKAVSSLGLTYRTATIARTGMAELATDAECIAGTDTSRIVTPANITARIATASEVTTGTDTKKLVSPEALATAELVAQILCPTGTMVAFAGASAPTGWLMCDGTAVSRTTYSRLFGVIGTTFGAGNGTTTFNLPNAVNNALVGAGSDYTRGTTYGAATATTSTNGSHSHTTSAAGNHAHGTDSQGSHTHSVTVTTTSSGTVIPKGTGDFVVCDTYQGVSTGSTGSGGSHSHSTDASGDHAHSTTSDGNHTHTVSTLQRSLAVNMIIRI